MAGCVMYKTASPASACKNLAIPVCKEVVESCEQCRMKEWKVVIPTIGAIYSYPDQHSLYGTGPIVNFMSGLGRPFRDEEWTSKRHWLRAWTLQESPPFTQCLIAGLPGGDNDQRNSCTY